MFIICGSHEVSSTFISTTCHSATFRVFSHFFFMQNLNQFNNLGFKEQSSEVLPDSTLLFISFVNEKSFHSNVGNREKLEKRGEKNSCLNTKYIFTCREIAVDIYRNAEAVAQATTTLYCPPTSVALTPSINLT